MRVPREIALGTTMYLALRAASQCKAAVLPFWEPDCGRLRIPNVGQIEMLMGGSYSGPSMAQPLRAPTAVHIAPGNM